MGSQEETFKHFFNDMRAFLSMETLAIGLGAVLMKWGFLDTPPDPKVFARYMGGVARAVCTSILQTRQELERERVKKSV